AERSSALNGQEEEVELRSTGQPRAAVPMWLPEAVLALGLAFGQPSHARQWAPAVRHCNSNHDFGGPRCVVDSYFHAIEVTADECCVFVAQGNVEGNP